MTRDRGFAVVATFTEHVSADAFAALLLSREIKAHEGERDPLTLSPLTLWMGGCVREAARRAFEREPVRRPSRAAAIASWAGVSLLVLAALEFAGAISR